MNISSIVPITKVHLLKGVPLDHRYTDVIDFANESSQYTYFISKRKAGHSYENLTPIKLENAIQLPVCSDTIYDCNYLMFQNANFTTKWLYAFITRVEFISINCCNVFFELDLMQTWQFDYDVNMSLVEREHVTNDSVGANTLDEGLYFGDYITNSQGDIIELEALSILVAHTATETVPGYIINKCPQAIRMNAYSLASISEIGAFWDMIETEVANGSVEEILYITVVPTAMIPDLSNIGGNLTTGNIPFEISNTVTSINGYVPRNNKLFCFPYNLLHITNNQGSSADYKYELFSGGMHFIIDGTIGSNPVMYLYPMGYAGGMNYENGLSLSGYPLGAWSNDTYKVWLAQNKNQIATGIASGILSTIAGFATGQPLAIAGGLLGAAQSIGSIADMSVAPDQARGNFNNSEVNIRAGKMTFSFYRKTIRAEHARVIDDFFTRYGYRVNRLKVPNIKTRQSYNYVKTNTANVNGSIPFNDLSKIASIYDNGVTFWHGDWVGDYSRTNNNI